MTKVYYMILYCSFRQLPQCIYPIVSTFFYTTLCVKHPQGTDLKYTQSSIS